MVDVVDKPVVQSDRAQVQNALRELGAQTLFDTSSPNVDLQQGRITFITPSETREPVVQLSAVPSRTRFQPVTAEDIRRRVVDLPLAGEAGNPPPVPAEQPDPETVLRQQEAAALLTKARWLHHHALIRLAEVIGTEHTDAASRLRDLAERANLLQKQLDRTLDSARLQELRDQFRDLEHELQVVVLDVTVRTVKGDLAVAKPYTHLVIPALLVAYGIMALWSLTGPAGTQLPVLQLPYSVLAIGLVGGTMACFYRYIRVGPLNLLPGHTIWFATKPWLGMLTAAFAFLALQVGLFVFGSEMTAPAASDSSRMTVFLVIAWLVAFSDWFFEKVVTALAGKVIGGDGAGVLSSLEAGRSRTSSETFLTDFMHNPDILTATPAQPVPASPAPAEPAGEPTADMDLLELDDTALDEVTAENLDEEAEPTADAGDEEPPQA